MPRPINCRRVLGAPASTSFKPAGIPCSELETVVMTLDEFEALRLTDLDGLYQSRAAERMGISRPTLSRIVESARAKVAMALVRGMELRIEGGFVIADTGHGTRCPNCSRNGAGESTCPRCRQLRD